ncbi:sporulation protein YabP [Clostridium sp. 'deep sea']|uniref:sporulation protein YabP n=1 Tax=Clostridium sp. 'deep sea' TaxID=2779445 RepID=UPI0018967E0C|nr:sporulation protein YabP [Clostridium sp. 'deep sea']QOR34519.1 sporulation protein YabP [Clostridium sp. 'deep sea']
MEQNNKEHRMIITNREQLLIQGVLHISSFNDEEIILETDLGMLLVQGEELHIKQLNLDDSHIEIEGVVKTLDYLEDVGPEGFSRKKQGLIARLFK